MVPRLFVALSLAGVFGTASAADDFWATTWEAMMDSILWSHDDEAVAAPPAATTVPATDGSGDGIEIPDGDDSDSRGRGSRDGTNGGNGEGLEGIGVDQGWDEDNDPSSGRTNDDDDSGGVTSPPRLPSTLSTAPQPPPPSQPPPAKPSSLPIEHHEAVTEAEAEAATNEVDASSGARAHDDPRSPIQPSRFTTMALSASGSPSSVPHSASPSRPPPTATHSSQQSLSPSRHPSPSPSRPPSVSSPPSISPSASSSPPEATRSSSPSASSSESKRPSDSAAATVSISRSSSLSRTVSPTPSVFPSQSMSAAASTTPSSSQAAAIGHSMLQGDASGEDDSGIRTGGYDSEEESGDVEQEGVGHDDDQSDNNEDDDDDDADDDDDDDAEDVNGSSRDEDADESHGRWSGLLSSECAASVLTASGAVGAGLGAAILPHIFSGLGAEHSALIGQWWTHAARNAHHYGTLEALMIVATNGARAMMRDGNDDNGSGNDDDSNDQGDGGRVGTLRADWTGWDELGTELGGGDRGLALFCSLVDGAAPSSRLGLARDAAVEAVALAAHTGGPVSAKFAAPFSFPAFL